jgi:hypothetical protein
VPFLTAFVLHVAAPLYLSVAVPENLSGEWEPLVTSPEKATPGVSVRSRLSVPFEAFAFGVHLYFAAPLAVSPAALSTEHDTAAAVFSVAFDLRGLGARGLRIGGVGRPSD